MKRDISVAGRAGIGKRTFFKGIIENGPQIKCKETF